MNKYKLPKKGSHGYRDFKTKKEAEIFFKKLKRAGFKPKRRTVYK